jgi:MFS family permease
MAQIGILLSVVNAGFAALTMNKELGLTAEMFGFGVGIFFFGYFIFKVPSNLVLERIGARRWIARIMVSWGVISVAFAFVPAIAAMLQSAGLFLRQRANLQPHAFYLRRGGGRVFSRHHPLSDLLVHGRRARALDRPVHGGQPAPFQPAF